MISNDSENRDHGEIKGWLKAVHELPRLRRDKVDRIRQALQDHSYETERMLDETIDRLSRDVGIAV